MPDQEVILTVDYDNETIDCSDEEARIYCSVEGEGDPELPRQVRWVAADLKQGDTLVVRAKETESASLFDPGKQGEYRLSGPYASATSGTPVDPFENTEASAVAWPYDIEVQRENETLFERDPIVIIERDG